MLVGVDHLLPIDLGVDLNMATIRMSKCQLVYTGGY